MTSTPLEALLVGLDTIAALHGSKLVAEGAAAIRELLAQVDLGHANCRMMQDDLLKVRAELATAQRRLLETQTSGQTRYMIEADQLRAELEAAKKDAERLDWIEQQHGLHRAIEFLYLPVGAFEIQHTYDGNAVGKPIEGETFRSAIDAALAAREGP